MAALLGGALNGVESSLRLVGTVAEFDPGDPEHFADAAAGVGQPTTRSITVAAEQDDAFVVTAAVGDGPGKGQRLSDDRELLARRALSTTDVVSGLTGNDGEVRLTIAIGNAAGPGTVVLQETAISPTTPAPSTPTSPFRSLDIALYLGDRSDPSALVVTTTGALPLTGITVEQPFPVGADTWLIIAHSSSPLVGSIAIALPWIILALGLLAAALLTAIVETLARRKEYASSVVAERTASLQAAMADLESAQARLVRQERLAAVGQLAASVGHELRNPLGVIANVLYLIEAETRMTASASMRRHLATGKREVTASTSIVSDLLDYATDRTPILAAVQVPGLISEVVSVAPAPNGVDVITYCEPPIVIDADHDQIRQVLVNLLSMPMTPCPTAAR